MRKSLAPGDSDSSWLFEMQPDGKWIKTAETPSWSEIPNLVSNAISTHRWRVFGSYISSCPGIEGLLCQAPLLSNVLAAGPGRRRTPTAWHEAAGREGNVCPLLHLLQEPRHWGQEAEQWPILPLVVGQVLQLLIPLNSYPNQWNFSPDKRKCYFSHYSH